MGFTQMLKQDLQMLALRTRHGGPAFPSPIFARVAEPWAPPLPNPAGGGVGPAPRGGSGRWRRWQKEAGRRGRQWPGSGRLGQPRAPAPPRGEVCGKFCTASRGVVTQRLGLQARTEKRGKARLGEREAESERKRVHAGVLLDPPDPPLPLPPLPPGPRARPLFLPFPSHAARFPSPLPLQPSSPGLRSSLRPPSSRPASFPPPPPPLLSPGGITSSRPGGRREPLAGGHHSPAPLQPPRAAPALPRSPHPPRATPRAWGPAGRPSRPGLITCCAAPCSSGVCTSAARPPPPPPPSRVRRFQLGQLRGPGAGSAGERVSLDFFLLSPRPPPLQDVCVCVCVWLGFKKSSPLF